MRWSPEGIGEHLLQLAMRILIEILQRAGLAGTLTP